MHQAVVFVLVFMVIPWCVYVCVFVKYMMILAQCNPKRVKLRHVMIPPCCISHPVRPKYLTPEGDPPQKIDKENDVK